MAGSKASEETRNKLSQSHLIYYKENPISKERRQKLSETIKAYYERNPPSNIKFYNLVTKEIVLVTNVSNFCIDRDLSYSSMRNVLSGRYIKHKDWALSFTPKEPRTAEKSYEFLYEGEIIYITNLKKFCRENGVDYGCMRGVFKGKQLSHQGYTNLVPRGRKKNTYKFLYQGEIVEVTSFDKFCDDNGLNTGCMYLVLRGKQKAHRGYTKYCQAE